MVKVRDLGSRECGFESRPPYKLASEVESYFVIIMIMIKD